MSCLSFSEPSVCARCASVQPTCCQIAPGQEEHCFPLSDVELDRIRDFAPGKRGWFASEPNSAAFVAGVVRLFPRESDLVRAVFPAVKAHNRLAVGQDGRCAFLTVTGCGLPREVRPYYCRLFPLWVDSGKLRVLEAACPARLEARGVGHLMRELDTTPRQVSELHGRLRLAWGLPPREAAENAPYCVIEPRHP